MVLKTRPAEALFGANKIVWSTKTWSVKREKATQIKKGKIALLRSQ